MKVRSTPRRKKEVDDAIKSLLNESLSERVEVSSMHPRFSVSAIFMQNGEPRLETCIIRCKDEDHALGIMVDHWMRKMKKTYLKSYSVTPV